MRGKVYFRSMDINDSSSHGAPDTIAELRDLYRSAESRSARLRLLIEAGRDLASAKPEALDQVLAVNARRAALFAGYRDGEISFVCTTDGVPLIAPGPEERQVGTLKLVGRADLPVDDHEDREALGMLAQLMAAAIDRAARENERDSLLSVLQEREKRLEHLVSRLFSAQEDERRYVSRELHDGVAQTATALFRRLDARVSTNEQSTCDDANLAEIAKGLVRELRAVIAGLRPTVLDDLGLVPAIETLADELRAEGFDVEFIFEGTAEWPLVLKTAYFRIAQEAISNIRKHAGRSCRVQIALKGDNLKKRWALEIRDFGVGIRSPIEQIASDGQHVGIEMMRERMSAIGGTLEINSMAPGVAVKATKEVSP